LQKKGATIMYWEKIVNAFLYDQTIIQQKIDRPIKPRNYKTYHLGAKFENIYFTKREAECMLLMLKEKTLHQIATTLQLSPRTIEYYTKNMKIKLSCHSKRELIQLVKNSDFISNVDFDV